MTCANNSSYVVSQRSGGDYAYSCGWFKSTPRFSLCAWNQEHLSFCHESLSWGLYRLDAYVKRSHDALAVSISAMQDAELWHARFGHVNYGSLLALNRLQLVDALPDLEAPPKHV